MNYFEPIKKPHFIRQNEIEQVQKQKEEYFLLGTFLRTRGLLLYQFNPINKELIELSIKIEPTLILTPFDDKLVPKDASQKSCTVDSRNIYFEALNLWTANKRVAKYLKGEIPELCNLKKANKDGIKFY